jgi:hypothetical protein
VCCVGCARLRTALAGGYRHRCTGSPKLSVANSDLISAASRLSLWIVDAQRQCEASFLVQRSRSPATSGGGDDLRLVPSSIVRFSIGGTVRLSPGVDKSASRPGSPQLQMMLAASYRPTELKKRPASIGGRSYVRSTFELATRNNLSLDAS